MKIVLTVHLEMFREVLVSRDQVGSARGDRVSSKCCDRWSSILGGPRMRRNVFTINFHFKNEFFRVSSLFFPHSNYYRIKIILSNLLKEGYIRSIILPSRNKYIAIVKLKVSFFKLISLN